MNNFVTRVITSVVAGGIFFGLYIVVPSFFLCLLASLAGYMVFIEWPRINAQSELWSYWYPVVPLLFLIFHVFIWQETASWYGIYPFLAAWVVDAAGYMVGSRWGTHYCWPQVSPHKTWEGVAAGICALLLVHGLLFVFSLTSYSGLVLLSSAPLIAFFAIAGDFYVSWHKRKRGIKDTGSLLPGHGGLLDRFDSVLGVVVALTLFAWL